LSGVDASQPGELSSRMKGESVLAVSQVHAGHGRVGSSGTSQVTSLALTCSLMDVCSAAVNGHELAALPQLSKRTTNRHACNAVLLGQLHLARQARVGSECPGINSGFDLAATWTVTGVAESCLIRPERSDATWRRSQTCYACEDSERGSKTFYEV